MQLWQQCESCSCRAIWAPHDAWPHCVSTGISRHHTSSCTAGVSCLNAESDYHFHRRNKDGEDGTRRWSDKNGAAPTRCCWPDPALQDYEDAGANGIPDDEYEELEDGGWIELVIATEACTRPRNYLYSQVTHLTTAESGGTSAYNCAAPHPDP